MWPLNVELVQGVGECWQVHHNGPHVERMDHPRGGEVVNTFCQKASMEGQRMSVLQLEPGRWAHQQEEEQVGATERENQVRTPIEALPPLAIAQPACI